MNINDLTIGQAKELVSMMNSQMPSNHAQDSKAHALVGLYVIARCYSAGVHAGEVYSVDGENVILKNSRRLWSWKAKEGIALSGLAQYGLKKEGGKVDAMNPVIYLTGVCELIPCANGVKESINDYK